MKRTHYSNEQFRRINRLVSQLTLIIVLLSVSLIVLGIFYVRTMSSLDRGYSSLVENELGRLRLIQRVTAQTFLVNRKCGDLVASPVRGNVSETGAEIRHLVEQQRADMGSLKALRWADKTLLNSMELMIDHFDDYTKYFLDILSQQGEEAAKDFRTSELRPQLDRLNEVFGALASSTYEEALTQSDSSSSATSRWLLIGSSLAGWPFLIVLTTLIWGIINFLRYYSKVRPEDELPV